MANGWKVASGILKGALGCTTFVCGSVINAAFKVVSGGIPVASGEGNPFSEAWEVSKFWFEDAKNDLEEGL